MVQATVAHDPDRPFGTNNSHDRWKDWSPAERLCLASPEVRSSILPGAKGDEDGGTTMSELDLETVRCELLEDHVALVTLHNPPVNAHSAQMLADIPLMFDRLWAPPHSRCPEW